MSLYKKIILIDIRNDSECMEKYLISNNKLISIYNIPHNHIAFNKKWIIELSNDAYVYIICRSGNRSDKIKNAYFKDIQNIISLEGGISNIKIFEGIAIIIDRGGWGKMQYVQFSFLVILLTIFLLVYQYYSRIDMLLILSLIITFVLYQLISKTCYIEKLIPLYQTSL
jgi:rhodanese-related sulfurtransferase